MIKLFDPLRDPKDVAKELSALLTKAKGQGASNEQIKEAIKKELPDLDGLQQANAEKIREQFHNELSGQLPEGSDAKQVFIDWKKANIKMPVEQKKALLENPSLLIDKVASDYKLKKFETKIVEDEKSKNNEIKKTTYVKLRKLLKDSKKLGSGAKFNFERKHSKSTNLGDQDGTEAEKMTGRIIQKWIDKA